MISISQTDFFSFLKSSENNFLLTGHYRKPAKKIGKISLLSPSRKIQIRVLLKLLISLITGARNVAPSDFLFYNKEIGAF